MRTVYCFVSETLSARMAVIWTALCDDGTILSVRESMNASFAKADIHCPEVTEIFQKHCDSTFSVIWIENARAHPVVGPLLIRAEQEFERPVIYCFISRHYECGDLEVAAVHEDGTHLASQTSSNIEWAKADIGVTDKNSYHHNIYKKYCPSGYSLAWISDVDQCEPLKKILDDAAKPKTAGRVIQVVKVKES